MSIIRKIIKKVRRDIDIEALKKKGLIIGDDVFINFGCIIDESFCFLIKIGNRVTLAPNVHILAHDASTKRELGYTKIGCVSIGDDVFVGAGTIIMPGVTIGNKVIIGAGSVVTNDIPDNSMVYGVPAQIHSTYDEYMAKMENYKNNTVVFDKTYTMRENVSLQQKEEMREKLKDNIGFIV